MTRIPFGRALFIAARSAVHCVSFAQLGHMTSSVPLEGNGKLRNPPRLVGISGNEHTMKRPIITGNRYALDPPLSCTRFYQSVCTSLREDPFSNCAMANDGVDPEVAS
jgi:hypothetical protein